MASSRSSNEEQQAREDFLKLSCGFTQMATIRCAVELGIPDIVENHPDGVRLADLSSKLGCSPELLGRIMRLLTHHHIFKRVMKMNGQDLPTIAYARTALSHLLTKNQMAHFFLFISSPEVIASNFCLSKYLLSENSDVGAFEAANSMNIWQYIAANPGFGELVNKGLASTAMGIMSEVLENYAVAFEGIGCLVDVGGGNGTALRMVAKACPWITRAIIFDLPHVVAPLVNEGRVEHVGGDMFETVPSADAALLIRILHDWDDESCVKILRNCKKQISKETGKVIIIEIVVDEEDNENLILSNGSSNNNNNWYRDFHLIMDIEMMALTLNGKERTSQEWDRVLKAAGFSKYTIKHFLTLPQSVIEAYQ